MSAAGNGVTVGVAAPIPAGADPASVAAVLDDIAAAGVDHLVVGDHVTFFGGFGVDGLIHATSLLSLHPTLAVHSSVYLLPLRHPVLVARQLATLSSIAPGRLVLGVGIGGEDPQEIRACGVDPSTRGRRMDECMIVLDQLQTGAAVTFHGEHFQLDHVAVHPPPSPPIPLVVGGRSDAAVRRAGRLGAGWLGIWVSPRRFTEAVHLAESVADAAGRPALPCRHGMTVWCGLGDDRADATAAVAPVMEAIYGLPFSKFERYVPRGTPAQVADALRDYVDAGCRTFNLLAQSRDRTRIPDAVGEVRQRLLGAT